MKKIFVFLFFLFLFTFSTSEIKAQVVINEFQVKPSQWIELFNKGDNSIDISNWIIDDNGGVEKYTISSSVALQSKRCISFQSGNFHWNTATADDIRLFSSQNNLIEEYHYATAPAENVSVGRLVDGEGELTVLSSVSRDKLNATAETCLATPSPTPIPTSAPTATPTSTPAPTPTPTPTKIPTSKPIAITTTSTPADRVSTPNSESQVLAAREELKPTSTPTSKFEKTDSEKKFPVVAGILIVAGVVFVSLATLPFIRMRLKGYNEKHGSGRGGEEIS